MAATSEVLARHLSCFEVMDGQPFHLVSACRELTIQILWSSVDHIASASIAAASAFSIVVAGGDAFAQISARREGER